MNYQHQSVDLHLALAPLLLTVGRKTPRESCLGGEEAMVRLECIVYSHVTHKPVVSLSCRTSRPPNVPLGAPVRVLLMAIWSAQERVESGKFIITGET